MTLIVVIAERDTLNLRKKRLREPFGIDKKCVNTVLFHSEKHQLMAIAQTTPRGDRRAEVEVGRMRASMVELRVIRNRNSAGPVQT